MSSNLVYKKWEYPFISSLKLLVYKLRTFEFFLKTSELCIPHETKLINNNGTLNPSWDSSASEEPNGTCLLEIYVVDTNIFF